MPLLLRTMNGAPGLLRGATGEILLPPGKPFAALCLIALDQGGVARDDLVHLLWPDAPVSRARASVRQALHVVRKAAGTELVSEEGGFLIVRTEGFRVDLAVLEEAVSRGDLDAAHALWQGGPFAHFSLADAPAFNDWADGVRSRHERHLGTALQDAARAAGQMGDVEAALTRTRQALDVRPYDEAAHALHLTFLLELGLQEEAEAALLRARASVEELPSDAFDAFEDRLRALRRQRVSAQAETVDQPTLQFVGRTREMASLRAQWRTVLSGRPRSVAILGEAGIGKSRLAAEFVRNAPEAEVQVVGVKAVDSERSLQLGLVAELAKELASRPGAAGISNASLSALHRLVPSLGSGTDADTSLPLSDVALGDALADMVDAVGSEAPLILCIEDLQWADSRSRVLFLRLARSLRGVQVLTLVTCRSGDADLTTVRVLRGEAAHGRFDLLELEALSVGEVRETLDLSLVVRPESETDRAAQRLRAVSRGNPLFLSELLLLLLEQGLVRKEADHWVLPAEQLSEDLPLPSTVQEILERRLSDLPEGPSSLLAALARAPAPRSQQEVADTLGVPVVQVEGWSRDLVGQGLIQRTPGGDLAYTHDSLRDAVRVLHPPAVGSPRSGFRWDLALAMVAMAVLVSLGVARERTAPPPLPAFGGGFLIVAMGREVVRLPVPRGRARTWAPESLVTLPDTVNALLAYLPREGPPRTFVSALVPSGRYGSFELLDGGALRPVFDHDGDVVVQDVSPDGRYLLVALADEDRGPWHLDLARLDLLTGDTVSLYEPAQALLGRWLPDGSAVVASTRSDPDTLLVLRPDGLELARHVVPGSPEDFVVGNCGPGRAVTSRLRPGENALIETVDLASGSRVQIPPRVPILWGNAVCSPDGTVAAYTGLVDSTERLVLQDLATGDTLLGPPGIGLILAWSAERPEPVPAEVLASDVVLRMEWGDQVRPRARVRFSDGTVREDAAVRWASLDPRIAYVAGDGRVFATAPGATALVADVQGWISDTVEVVVHSGIPPLGALLADRFETLDSSSWVPFGRPTPVPTTFGREPVLDLRGDGVGNDGIRSAKRYDLSRGATLELSFRLHLTRRDRQSFAACLMQVGSDDTPTAPVPDAATDWACFVHPSHELAAFDASSFSLYSTIPVGRLRDPARFPTDGWTHVALVLAPDGAVRLLLDGVESARLPHPLRMDPAARWEVELSGRAVDTQLLIRDLVLWEGMRY